MSIFSRKKDEGELAVLFDIGSSTVGGTLFYLNKNQIPKIVFSFREEIKAEQNFDFNRFLSNTLKTLEDVVCKICLSGVGVPKKFFCVLSSPWYASQTRIIRLEKNTPFVFNAKLADGLIQKEIEFFKEEELKKYNENKSKAIPIELRNMKTMLNGYVTSDPIDKKARELEMSVFISISSERFLNQVQETVHKNFHQKNIKFSSFAIVTFAVTRELFIDQENFLLVDIGGEITDIAMVKKDILSNSVSFPKGINFITRGIAEITGSSMAEAKSMLSLYKDGHAEALTEKRLEPMISKLKSEWLSDFQNSLANLSRDISIPATIFITIDKDFSQFFADIIKTEQFSQYTLSESKFRVVFLGADKMNGQAIVEKGVPHDAFAIMNAVYINKFIR